MNDADARRRNHWVSHIARHAHARPGAVYLRFEGAPTMFASNALGAIVVPVNKRALRGRFG